MDKITGLRQIAQNIETRRVQLELSKNALCQKFGQLGSTKTYGRILNTDDDLAGMDIEAQLANYRAAWELLQQFDEDPSENKIHADFQFMLDGLDMVTEALRQTDNTRFVLVTAGTGGGKSTFLDLLEEHEHTKAIVYRVEATEAWRSKISDFLGALLTEIGVFDRAREGSSNANNANALPQSSDERLRKLIERLDSKRVILAVDEGQHLGPEGLNVLKTIINQTRAVVVLAAIPELIARINKKAFAETKQLFQNRLFGHVRLGEPTAPDVMEYLKRRGVKFRSAADENKVVQKLVADAQHFGLWKFVKRCTTKAKRLGAELSQDDFVRIIVKVKSDTSLGG